MKKQKTKYLVHSRKDLAYQLEKQNDKIKNLEQEVSYLKKMLNIKTNICTTSEEIIKMKEKRIDNLEQEVSCSEKMLNIKTNTSEEIIKMREKRIDNLEKQNSKLKQDNFNLSILIPEKFPINTIMKECADASWYGKAKGKLRQFQALNTNIKLIFEGRTYEQSYEDFTAGCCVYAVENGERYTLYSVDGENVAAYRYQTVENGSIENIREYIVSRGLKFVEIGGNENE